MDNSIHQVLSQASKTLEDFIEIISTSKAPVSKKEIDDFSHHLKETHAVLKNLRNLRDYNVKSLESHSEFAKEIQLIQKLLTEIHVIKDKVTQEKAGALQASLFWNTIEDFQNLIKNLKEDHKRGIRAEKVDSLEPEE
ncbi:MULTISPECIES: hypothetical protein [Parachlamydia]|jgi:Mn-dependent DtxR family transcriptional regulator|uniref:Uncharacterized protein n=2 Tax=Parachlamydia acanthamoebae TaxID=83552 RepID=F8KZ44_PARAV|nr:hypothetical protein [Parachlamydia acanthamoebae]EFB41956.1 hypothetical protein pah_c022o293 [Parachlamydia acanthamoebae str. Hall's coccus]KIA78098.1 hypothetical protein DB43_EW00080 [Parachlamydia acanthamoebae]CCB86167.1 putative uncharacterized protein [Parachlamydia acanthamoebae UV-7]